MGILNNTVSICQFQVVGTPPATELSHWVGEGLAGNGFRSIEQGGEELSIGWVELDDYQQSGFADSSRYQRDHYIAFALRRDQRKLPSALLKPGIREAEEQWLAQNPTYKRVPKQQRETLREAVRANLFVKTLPVPAIYDVVWDTQRNLVTFCSLSTKVVDLFVDQFKKSFEGLRLVPLHPMARADEVLSGEQKAALKQADCSGSDAVLEKIEANTWLGKDFLLWLMHATMNSAAEFRVSQPGPALQNDEFVAYLNDRLLLVHQGEQGQQKVTVTGPQERFDEVRTALQQGKEIVEAVLYLEKREHQWKLNLKAENFHFGSLKSPGVTLEKEAIIDVALEKEAVFYERQALLEEAQQLFNSLLAAFLKERLADDWGRMEQQIRELLAEA